MAGNKDVQATLSLLKGVDISLSETITHRTWTSLAPEAAPRSTPSAGLETLPEIPLSHGPDDGGTDLLMVSPLGKGGMGVVHAAAQRSLSREVAVKMLHPGADSEAGQSLVNEARYTGMLEHPNIPPVHALCRSGDQPVLVMKLIDGVAWSELLADPDHEAWQTTKHHSDPPLVRHVEILVSVCDALQYAHSHGVVHRDLKPENVMVGSFGEVYLLDWGIAARIDDLAEAEPPLPMVGTLAYMAPEMTLGQADERTDVFLAGAVLHKVLTGEPRNVGNGAMAVLLAAYEQEPYLYADDLPEELVRICRTATAKEPDDRYPTILALREVLQRWLRHRGAEQLVAASRRRLEGARQVEGQEQARLLAECRFGFIQALAELPDNPEAILGLREALLELAELELERGNLEGAQALLEELGEEIPQQLAARVEALRREHTQQLRARELAREMDAGISRRERFIFFTALVLVTVPMWIFTFSRDRTGETGVTTLRAISYPAFTFGLFTAAAIAFWRRLAKNRVSQQWLLTVLAVILFWGFSRVVAWHNEVHIATAIAFDLIIIGLGVVLVAIWDARWVLPALTGIVIAEVVLAFRPELYLTAFLLSFALAVGWVALGFRLGWSGARQSVRGGQGTEQERTEDRSWKQGARGREEN